MKIDCHDCCAPIVKEPDACGCCEGIEIVTPLSTYNRPGLSEISYRIGTHADFFETMTARLTGFFWEQPNAKGELRKVYPLKDHTTRESNDPALALLDAWATVADVLTFYQERIANEGYLRTATERRSLLEMARLVGYEPRPGVAASVFLAYTVDANFPEETVIPAGSRAQSIPGPDELPQSFETSDELTARAQWNNLKPRQTRAQTRSSIINESVTEPNSDVQDTNAGRPRVYLRGINTNIKQNDAILIDFADHDPRLFSANEILPDPEQDHTLVTFTEHVPAPPAAIPVGDMIDRLVRPASIQPANQFLLRQSLAGQFALQHQAVLKNVDTFSGAAALPLATNEIARPTAQAGYAVLGAFSPILKEHLATATSRVKWADKEIKVYHLGIKAALFGHNLPLPTGGRCPSEPPIINLEDSSVAADNSENLRILALDAEYPSIKIGDYVAIKTGQEPVRISKMVSVEAITLGGPPQSGNLAFFRTCSTMTTIRVGRRTTTTESDPIKLKVTVLTLDSDWRAQGREPSEVIKNTTVYIQSGNPELAEEPITEAVCRGKEETIELDGFYSGLEAGRWVIVSGELDDVPGARFSEPALLDSVTHDIERDLPDEHLHTYIQLAENLAYCFKRDTVTIHGNVVKATHGETRREVLGAGNGTEAFQSFELKQFPLTHVSAANPKGIDSTLKVFVNDIEWRENDSLFVLHANDRKFISKTDNEDKTRVIFGNGKNGARLMTGVENIRAEYRNGIGKPGNVKAGQISLLLTKPLGVKEVINPLLASGGADRETGDQARRHIPLAVKALDRLVSVRDYQDFSQVYAGIGKAHALELSDGRQQRVHVTIAGADDIPIEEHSDLFRNLRQALHDFGDPHQAIQLAVRELKFIVIEAGIAILPDYQWESMVNKVRITLLDHFGFDRRELGQDVLLSEIISVMQSVRGVAYVDVDAFGGIPEKISKANGNRRLLTPDEISFEVAKIAMRTDQSQPDIKNRFNQERITVPSRLAVNQAAFENHAIRPAQLAFLSPDVPATLILNRIERLS